MATGPKLTLGNFTFLNEEVPSQISVGGIQQLARHQLIGGTRRVDAMGRSDDPIEWSGWFMGEHAQARSDYLNAYRIAGTQQRLTWSSLNYLVIVQEYRAVIRREFEIQYRIVCEVIQDLTTVASTSTPPPIDTALAFDLETALSLTSNINDAALTIAMAALSGAIGAQATLAGAPQSIINTVLQPLAAAAAQTSVLASAANSVIAVAPGFGGVTTGAAAGAAAVSLTAQLGATEQLSYIVQLQAVLGRMDSNLGAINSSNYRVIVAGGNLYQMSAQQYGDATDWTTIAKANGLTDPMISGTPQTLIVPPSPDGSDGVLNA